MNSLIKCILKDNTYFLRVFVSCPKVGDKTSDYSKSEGKNQNFIAIMTDFGQNSAKVGGSCPPCTSLDKCPVLCKSSAMLFPTDQLSNEVL